MKTNVSEYLAVKKTMQELRKSKLRAQLQQKTKKKNTKYTAVLFHMILKSSS